MAFLCGDLNESKTDNWDNGKMTPVVLTLMVALGLAGVLCALGSLFPAVMEMMCINTRSLSVPLRFRKSSFKRIQTAFILLAFVGWNIILYQAIYWMLWFLPDSLGSQDEYGDWQSYRSYISGTAGFILGFFILQKLESRATASRRKALED